MRRRNRPSNQPGRPSSLESAVNRFAGTLDSASLIKALRASDTEQADQLPELLLRSGLVRTRSFGDDEARATALLRLRAGVADLRGSDHVEEIDRALLTIEVAERGYRAIGQALEQLLKLHTPEVWLWAVLDQSCALLEWALREVDRRAAATNRVDGSTFALPDGSGGEYRADELVAMVDATTSMCVRTLAARNGWAAADGAIVLRNRDLEQVEAPDVRRLTRLSELWAMWSRMETGARFLGGRLDEKPADGGLVRSLSPSADDIRWRTIAHVAHEQLSIEIMSVFNQLVYREDAHRAAVGIHGVAPLMPGALVSATEIHAYHALEVILAAEPVADTSQYLGLTIVEWIRGYSVLAALAEEAARDNGGPERLYVRTSAEALVPMLERLGLAR